MKKQSKRKTLKNTWVEGSEGNTYIMSLRKMSCVNMTRKHSFGKRFSVSLVRQNYAMNYVNSNFLDGWMVGLNPACGII